MVVSGNRHDFFKTDREAPPSLKSEKRLNVCFFVDVPSIENALEHVHNHSLVIC